MLSVVMMICLAKFVLTYQYINSHIQGSLFHYQFTDHADFLRRDADKVGTLC